MTALAGTCVCGHPFVAHDVSDDPRATCDLCGCRKYLDQHLPGQLTIGGDT